MQNFEFVEDAKAGIPPATVLVAANKVKARLREFIEKKAPEDVINEYIKVSFSRIQKQNNSFQTQNSTSILG